jgi:ABC-type nitrate/sulfonate/bicarbonate transport system substrate-binding protein
MLATVLRRLFGPAAALGVIGLSMTSFSAGAAELTTFKVGEASPANTFLAVWMAEAAGLYEAQGLKLEIVHTVGGRESGPDLSSGRIQLMHIGMSSVVRANAAGSQLKAIGSLSNVNRATMFAAPQIRTDAKLKGRIFGISSAGSESDAATTLVLQRLGLKREDRQGGRRRAPHPVAHRRDRGHTARGAATEASHGYGLARRGRFLCRADSVAV